MISRRNLKKIMWYAISIILFWNGLVAIRAWRFTHFADPQDITQATVSKAGMFDGMIARFKGKLYVKSVNNEKPNRTYETVYFNTQDNFKLEAWKLTHEQPAGTVIVFHGLQSSKQYMLNEAYGINDMGYNVLLVDFRAHGGSEGNRCTLGLEEAKDVKAAFEYLQNQGEKNIILYGASMGAATISRAISKYEIKPNKVILDMPFATYEQLIEKWFHQSRYPTQPTAKLFTFWAGVLNNNWFFKMKPVNYVKDIQCPVLLQWGRNDHLVPGTATEKIFFNIGSVNKRLAVYEKSGHESYAATEPELWKETVSGFLKN
jgi:uncharacterized protein